VRGIYHLPLILTIYCTALWHRSTRATIEGLKRYHSAVLPLETQFERVILLY
jgi:hypothetical protein